MRVLFATAAVAALSLTGGAEAHQCYRRVVEPAQYRTIAEQVLVEPEREVSEYAPAVTRTVERTVVVRPEQTVGHRIAAEYSEETQEVEVAPPHREWRTRDEQGDLIGCWVDVPARFGAVTRRVLVAPERVVTETIPEATATRLETEVVEPAHLVAHTIPARYSTREREVLVSPAMARWAPIDECER